MSCAEPPVNAIWTLAAQGSHGHTTHAFDELRDNPRQDPWVRQHNISDEQEWKQATTGNTAGGADAVNRTKGATYDVKG